MSVQIADWLLLTFFLFSLVLVARLRSITSKEGQSAHRQAVGGTIIFTMLALLRLIGHYGLLQKIPFISEPTFFQLITWIALISGGTLLLSGVFHWLPVYREHRFYNQRRIMRLGLLRKTEQLAGIEGRIDSLLKATLTSMIEHYGFKEGIVFKIALANRKLLLAASTMDPESETTRLEGVAFDESGWQKYVSGTPDSAAQTITGLRSDTKRLPIVLPIHLENRPLGIFVLWRDKDTEVDHDDELTLRIVTDIIARKMERNMITRQRLASARRYKKRLELKPAIEGASDLKEAMNLLAGAVRDVVPADIISLTLYDENRKQSQRVTSGENGTILLEQRLPAPKPGSLIEHLIRHEQDLLLENAQADEPFMSDDLVITHRLKSLIAVHRRDMSQSAILVVGSRQAGSFSRIHEGRLRELRPVLSQIARSEEMRQVSMNAQRRIARLNGLIARIAAGPPLSSVCEYAARLLIEESGADMIRVSKCDNSGTFLESLALEARDSIGRMIPASGVMVLSLMPRHQQLLKTAAEIRIERDDPDDRLSEAELNQIFSVPLGVAQLLPITVNGKSVGVISIANQPDSGLFKKPELLFAATVAEALGVAFKLDTRRDSVDDRRTRLVVAGRAEQHSLAHLPSH